jgi:hypothetical protein
VPHVRAILHPWGAEVTLVGSNGAHVVLYDGRHSPSEKFQLSGHCDIFALVGVTTICGLNPYLYTRSIATTTAIDTAILTRLILSILQGKEWTWQDTSLIHFLKIP